MSKKIVSLKNRLYILFSSSCIAQVLQLNKQKYKCTKIYRILQLAEGDTSIYL